MDGAVACASEDQGGQLPTASGSHHEQLGVRLLGVLDQRVRRVSVEIDLFDVNVRSGDVVLELGTRRVLLARDAGPEVIQAVVLVAQDLAAKARPYAELDARFAGQVVVRRRSMTRTGAS